MQCSYAATYYVSLAGNDATGDGSSGKPWRTLRYAVTRVPANQGHVIKLAGGTYVEAGLVEVPLGVSIEGAGKDVTILKAASGFYYYPATPAFAVDKFLISLSAGSPQNGNQSLKGFTVDGDGKKLHGGIYVRNRNFVLIDGVKVTNTNFSGIWLWDVKDTRLTNSNLLNCAWGSSAWVSGALDLGNAERLEIDNCVIDEGKGYGIKLLGPGVGTFNKLKIHDCTVTVNPVGLWNNGSAPNISIELMNAYMTDCEIYNCYVDNHISLANNETILSNGVKTMRVHHNTIDMAKRAGGRGYGIELSIHDCEVDNNYFIKGSYGIAHWGKQKKNWNIHHNVFYWIESGGYPGDVLRSQQSGLNNVKFYNNTIEMVGTRTTNLIGIYGGTSANVEIKNNLVINNNTAYSYYPNKFIHLEAGLSIANLQVANNLLDRLAMSTTAGQYSGNLTGDPQISKSGARPFPYYTPLSGSRLIDGGINVGLTYTGLRPDIGASESSGTGTTPGNNNPTVSITSPANNATVAQGTSVTIAANASDSDGTVSKVEFYNGSTLLGTDTSSPYSFVWSNVAAGSYSLKAVATDDDGASTSSAPVSIIALAPVEPVALPGTIQAENFSAMSGIQLESTGDTGGGQNVGYIETGDWMDYKVTVATAGTYQVQYRVASPSAGGSIQLRSGATTLATTAVASTGGWQTWQTINATVSLPAGSQTLRVYAATGGFNINWLQASTGNTTPPAPSGLPIPGIIQAESYTQQSGVKEETTKDTGGGENVGWIETGDWMDYNVSVATAGSYLVQYRVASPGAGGSIQLRSGTTTLATTAVPSSGGWQTWQTINATVTLPAGAQTLRIYAAAGGFNLNWTQFSAITASGITVPGIVQAENYSQQSGVLKETTKDTGGGQNVGWIDTGDWMDYDVNVITAGTYTVQYRVSSPSNVGKIQLKKGSTILATTAVPATGGWQTWQTVTATVSLSAGPQTLRLQAATGGFNLNWIQFTNGLITSTSARLADDGEIVTEEGFAPARIFSPNGDGLNDTWQWSDPETMTNCSLVIYDGAGRQVYQSSGDQLTWDGMSQGKSSPSGAYYYVITCDGKKITGSLQIVR